MMTLVRKPKVIHFAGRLEWVDKRGFCTTILAGWAACCSGRRAEAVRRDRNHTYDPKLVTCKECLKRLEWAEVTRRAGSDRTSAGQVVGAVPEAPGWPSATLCE